VVGVGVAQAADKKPNIVMLMQDDTAGTISAVIREAAWPSPFRPQCYQARQGGRDVHVLVRPGQLHSRAASFITGAFPIRSALSIVVAPGDEKRCASRRRPLRSFFKKNGYTTYFSGKWHLGRQTRSLSNEHGLTR